MKLFSLYLEDSKRERRATGRKWCLGEYCGLSLPTEIVGYGLREGGAEKKRKDDWSGGCRYVIVVQYGQH
ncbi:hypothetical protein WN55_01427 [Dufourea novaeangliae]|uniref:Uncharacterized protein n=1 Tax=Dufourea novaeangliae TaxID=178035 RepID=A0A154PEQ2_DUFNO|nr:hypothetical protein WN55_01427 [Dufourea novaeangliae]